MQTFLPYGNYTKDAACLDDKRLGKQRVEGMQLVKSILIPEYGWKQHPITQMWWFHPLSLIEYTEIVCLEWRARGYKDSVLEQLTELKQEFYKKYNGAQLDEMRKKPHFIGHSEFHASHRSNLLRKLPEHYSQFNWPDRDDLPYLWWTADKGWYRGPSKK